MGVINRQSRVWNATGIKPAAGDEIYSPGEQPIAGYDNWAMWAVTADIKELNTILGSHRHRHEAGGGDEIDLDGLGVGTAARLSATEDGELRILDQTGEEVAVNVDIENDAIRTWPRFADEVILSQGGEIGADLVRRDDGTQIYNYETGRVPAAEWAAEADFADHATTADDADTVDGKHADAFVEPHESVQWTDDHTFDQTVDADISGHAATAGHADTADVADYAPESGNSDTVDGYHAHELMDDGTDGQWEHITTDTHDIVGEHWTWNATSETVYDRYRLRIYHESHLDRSRKAFFWMNIGSNGSIDERHRYNWREKDTTNWKWTYHESHGWTVAGCWAGEISLSTYYITLPDPVNRPRKFYPVIGTGDDSVSRGVPRVLDYGHLRSEHDYIDTFQLWSAFNSTTGKVILEGQNLD